MGEIEKGIDEEYLSEIKIRIFFASTILLLSSVFLFKLIRRKDGINPFFILLLTLIFISILYIISEAINTFALKKKSTFKSIISWKQSPVLLLFAVGLASFEWVFCNDCYSFGQEFRSENPFFIAIGLSATLISFSAAIIYYSIMRFYE